MLVVLAVASVAMATACGHAAAPVTLPRVVGYTPLTPSPDSRQIFVSSSAGSDSNAGTEAAPVKTVAAGTALLRSGYPDWLLFKKGDVFLGGLGQWVRSGRSAQEPMVITSYGTGARPVFETAAGASCLVTSGSGGSPTHIDHVRFVGLDCYAHTRDPGSADFTGVTEATGVSWLRGADDLLIEDCVFRFYSTNVTIQDFDSLGITDVRFRYNQVLDAYGDGVAHSEGIYADAVAGLLLEGNLFDHNGWNSSPLVGSAGAATIFNHNVYIQNNNSYVTFSGNISLRASSNGAQLRTGGDVSGNLFVRNPIGLLVAMTATVDGNVILQGTDIDASNPRGWGLDLENIQSAAVKNTIIADVVSTGINVMAMTSNSSTTYSNDVVYHWGTSPFASPGPFVDPTRNVETYDASLGGPGTFDDFAARLRGQSRDAYEAKLAADAVNAYIRAGFAAP